MPRNPNSISSNESESKMQPNPGIETLEQMPSFNVMQQYREAKMNEKLPEGIRDEQDYKEYLEEKAAREKEALEGNSNIQSDVSPQEQMGTDSDFTDEAIGAKAENAKESNSDWVAKITQELVQKYGNGKVSKSGTAAKIFTKEDGHFVIASKYLDSAVDFQKAIKGREDSFDLSTTFDKIAHNATMLDLGDIKVDTTSDYQNRFAPFALPDSDKSALRQFNELADSVIDFAAMEDSTNQKQIQSAMKKLEEASPIGSAIVGMFAFAKEMKEKGHPMFQKTKEAVPKERERGAGTASEANEKPRRDHETFLVSLFNQLEQDYTELTNFRGNTNIEDIEDLLQDYNTLLQSATSQDMIKTIQQRKRSLSNLADRLNNASRLTF